MQALCSRSRLIKVSQAVRFGTAPRPVPSRAATSHSRDQPCQPAECKSQLYQRPRQYCRWACSKVILEFLIEIHLNLKVKQGFVFAIATARSFLRRQKLPQSVWTAPPISPRASCEWSERSPVLM